MINSIDVRVSNVGTSSAGAFSVSSVSARGKSIQIDDLTIGTTGLQEMSFPLSYVDYSSASGDIEQNIEDAVEDDGDEVWKTFLEIEPHYRTINRWLAES